MPACRHPSTPARPRQQRGAILLVTVVTLVVGLAAILVGSLSSSAIQIERDRNTAAALAQAKEALIGYAITYADNPSHSNSVDGYLPCPDINSDNGEGSSTFTNCGSKNVSLLGRLPWRTLDLPPLRDGSGECLWYAVAGTYKYNPKTDMMNWDTPGLLNVTDASGNTIPDVVAVIFAPGIPLSSQNRAPSGAAPICGGNYTAANYLDNDGTHDNASVSTTANATSGFYSGSSAQVNDRLVYITKQDIWNALMRRADFADPARSPLRLMTQKAAECLADYGRRNSNGTYDKRLPWAGRLSPAPSDYMTDSNYDDDGNLPRQAGRLPYRVNTSVNDTHNLASYPYYQLASDGSNCPSVAAEWQRYYPWWSNWKDHLYYAVAHDFNPDSSDTSCGYCLQVNGHGQYAAVVIFAGPALAGQTRAPGSDHLNLSNYLEGSNLTYIGNYSYSGGNYQSGTATSSFNDVLYCINPDLSVNPC